VIALYGRFSHLLSLRSVLLLLFRYRVSRRPIAGGLPHFVAECCRRLSVSPRQEADRSDDLHGHRDRVIYGQANRRAREITSHPIINSGYEISYSLAGEVQLIPAKMAYVKYGIIEIAQCRYC